MSARAQQVVLPLLSLTNVWKYDQSGADLGMAWRASDYDDSAWSMGKGILGFEDSVPFPYPIPLSQWTQLSLRGPNQANQTITYYFRTHFNFPTNLTLVGLSLVASNLVDDGLAMYLNGQERGRLRLAPNAKYSIIATAGPATEGQWDVFTLPTTNLVQGDNVLAVEVHQVSSTSPDIVFGMTLTATIPLPIVITNQPQSLTLIRGEPAVFNVGASGSNPTYRWYKITNLVTGAAQPISGATTNRYTIAAVSPANTGAYFVIVSNILGGVRSSNAFLTVLEDTTGPTLVRAVTAEPAADTNVMSAVVVTFSENVLRSSITNVDNYSICRLDQVGNSSVVTTNCVAILSATSSTNTVTLQTTPLQRGSNYVLTVNNVRDNSPNTNVIAPNSQVAVFVAIQTNLFGFAQAWDWNEDGVDLGTAWRAPDFIEDDSWGRDGPGVLGHMSVPSSLCGGAELNTFVSIGLPTYYFRTRFAWNSALGSTATLLINSLVKDGAVIYLNGVEIRRQNMPSGEIQFTTVPINSVPPFCFSGPVAVTNLSALNTFAVEVHQVLPADTVAFGMSLNATYLLTPSLPPAPTPSLSLSNAAAGLTLSWTGNGYFLESANSVTGRWTQVPNMSNPFTTAPSETAKFFRLVK